MARKYSKKASKKVEKVMRERKRGTLRSGRSGKKVTSRKQAIAIGLSEARRAGAKVPEERARQQANAARKRKARRRLTQPTRWQRRSCIALVTRTSITIMSAPSQRALMQPIISIKDLTKTYATGFEALKHDESRDPARRDLRSARARTAPARRR